MFASEVLAEFVKKINYEDIPEKIINKAKLCILDSIGCMLGGSKTKTGRIVLNSFKNSRDKGKKVTPVCAAFMYTTLANILDFDDTFLGIGHPGATIIPPALSCEEVANISGKDFLTSIVLGYEVSTRIGVSIQPSRKRREYVWGLGTWQTFGAVAAIAKIMGLNKEELVNAFAIAGSIAPVPSAMKTIVNPFGVTMVKNGFGAASAIGLLTVNLAKNGFRGPKDIFEGDTGFWRMFGSDRCRFGAITRDLGKKYFLEDITFKPFPCCRYMHSSLIAIDNIIKDERIRASEIKKIIIRSLKFFGDTPFNNTRVRSMEDAQFSLPYTAAMVVMGVNVGSDWFRDDKLNAPEVIKLAKKVEIKRNLEGDRSFPSRIVSKVTIETKRDSYNSKIEIPKGDPENPMTKKELENKFSSLSGNIIPGKKLVRIISIIGRLEKVKNIKEVADLLAII